MDLDYTGLVRRCLETFSVIYWKPKLSQSQKSLKISKIDVYLGFLQIFTFSQDTCLKGSYSQILNRMISCPGINFEKVFVSCMRKIRKEKEVYSLT